MMTKTPAEEMADLAKVATGLVEAVVRQEVQMLHLVEAELEVLAKAGHKPATPQEAQAAEAEIEAGFDNMPV
jgi:hypothetical protein